MLGQIGSPTYFRVVLLAAIFFDALFLIAAVQRENFFMRIFCFKNVPHKGSLEIEIQRNEIKI